MLDHKKELESFCQEHNVLEDLILSWEMSLREMAKGKNLFTLIYLYLLLNSYDKDIE